MFLNIVPASESFIFYSQDSMCICFTSKRWLMTSDIPVLKSPYRLGLSWENLKCKTLLLVRAHCTYKVLTIDFVEKTESPILTEILENFVRHTCKEDRAWMEVV